MSAITNTLYVLLFVVTMWSKILAEEVIKCKNDEYFDDKTGNCDKCKPICDISDCSHVCPYYLLTIPTNVQHDSRTIGLVTGCLVGLFLILALLLSYCLCKRHCKIRNIQNKKHLEPKIPVQATDDVLDRQDVQERELLNDLV
ncbi:hypothetical protein CHS0354_020334 [Potamilus streckersoni]|uniref:PTTG1IP n=1 Tax=Potamilus streckersoni TaxID=2493646 RepID=A0AAE0SGJ5_9BIVA|nr:hypothetical protein CHS0354_020334 [Potamilus streckersoni]